MIVCVVADDSEWLFIFLVVCFDWLSFDIYFKNSPIKINSEKPPMKQREDEEMIKYSCDKHLYSHS
jgi:hypothetical protein